MTLNVNLVKEILIEGAFTMALAYYEEKHVEWAEKGYDIKKPEREKFSGDYRPKWGNVVEEYYGAGEVNVFYAGNEYTVKEIDSYGGEGMGDEYWHLFKVNDQHFKLDAAWVSWDGVYWDDAELYEVEPKEVTITKWVPKK